MKAIVDGIEWGLTGHCEVQCDVCRDVYTTSDFKFPSPERRMKLAIELREAGWLVEGNHKHHVCPECYTKSHRSG